MAEIPENVSLAKIGYMRSVYALEEYKNTVLSVAEVLEITKAEEELIREAKYKRAKSYLAMANKSLALADFKDLAKETQTTEGAESKYRLAKLYFDKKQYDLSEKEINSLLR